MKKLLFLVTAICIVLASCSKERRINNEIYGQWKVKKVNGVQPSGSVSPTLTFQKTKGLNNHGTGTYEGLGQTGTYVIKGDVITFTDKSGTDPNPYNILKHSRKVFEIASQDGLFDIYMEGN